MFAALGGSYGTEGNIALQMVRAAIAFAALRCTVEQAHPYEQGAAMTDNRKDAYAELISEMQRFMSQSAPHHRAREWYKLIERATAALSAQSAAPAHLPLANAIFQNGQLQIVSAAPAESTDGAVEDYEASVDRPAAHADDDDLPGMLAVAKGIVEQRWPHTMDAAVWAAEFVKMYPGIDEGTMIGWFANAIMAGYDTAQARAAAPSAVAAPSAETLWQPIETVPMDDGWTGRRLFAIKRAHGWEMWVGQCDAYTIWLGRDDNGACWECDKPTHWAPLPRITMDGSSHDR